MQNSNYHPHFQINLQLNREQWEKGRSERKIRLHLDCFNIPVGFNNIPGCILTPQQATVYSYCRKFINRYTKQVSITDEIRLLNGKLNKDSPETHEPTPGATQWFQFWFDPGNNSWLLPFLFYLSCLLLNSKSQTNGSFV